MPKMWIIDTAYMQIAAQGFTVVGVSPRSAVAMYALVKLAKRKTAIALLFDFGSYCSQSGGEEDLHMQIIPCIDGLASAK